MFPLQNHVQLFFLVMGLFTTTLGLVLYHKSLSILGLCFLLVIFGTLEVMLMIFEMVKNEDTHTEELDMEELTQRIMLLAVGVIMVLAAAFLKLYQSHRAAIDNIMRLGNEKMPADMVALSSETTIHDFFRSCGNHFDPLERVAEQLAADRPCPPDEMYMMLKARLHEKHGITVTTLPIEDMKDALRIHDVEGKALHLSEALGYPNRTFQMAHVLCFVEFADILESITEDSSLTTKRSIDRCHIELANYFAAALLMPYDRFLCLLYTSPSPRDGLLSRMPSSA